MYPCPCSHYFLRNALLDYYTETLQYKPECAYANGFPILVKVLVVPILRIFCCKR